MPDSMDPPTKTGGVIYRISKTFYFEACHSLPHLPEGHKCKQLHGHSYQAAFVFEASELDEDGFVIDFGILSDAIGAYVSKNLDHTHLNARFTFAPTSELIARFLFQQFVGQFPSLVTVRVSESAGETWAEYSPN